MTIRGPFAYALVAILIVSLAANLLILGFAASRYRGADEASAIERIVALGVRAFPREMRSEINDQFGHHRSELRGAFRDVREARRHVFSAMTAEPFSRANLDAAFAEVRSETDKLQRLGQELVGDVVEAETPALRAKIRPPKFLHR